MRRLRICGPGPSKGRPRAQELFEQAVVEGEKMPQEAVGIERTPERMQAVLDANGGHTKWQNKR